MDYPWNFTISVEAVAAAIQCLWWCLESVQEAFALLPVHEHQPITRVRTALMSAGARGVTRRDLLRQACMHTTELDRVLMTLVDREEVVGIQVKHCITYFHRADVP